MESVVPSHLIVHVSNTDETIRFYQDLVGAVVSDDHTFAAPGLDSLFGRDGVVIRSTFIGIAGLRLHTIETVDTARERPVHSPIPDRIAITGLSLRVTDLDAIFSRAQDLGLSPSDVVEFDLPELGHRSRMFFVQDPDGTKIELLEEAASPEA